MDEKRYFGQVNTAYDFKVNDPKESERRIQKLTETKEKLAKSVNMRAMNMLGKAEEQVGYRLIYWNSVGFWNWVVFFIPLKPILHSILFIWLCGLHSIIDAI